MLRKLDNTIVLLLLNEIHLFVELLKTFQLKGESLQSSLVSTIQVKVFDDLFCAFLKTCFNLWFEVILHECPSNVRAILEVKVGEGVHREEALEELRVAVEVVLVYLYVEPSLNLLKILQSIGRCEEVLLTQLILNAFFVPASVHAGQIHDRGHLTGHVVSLGPILQICLQLRHALFHLGNLPIVNIVHTLL